MHANATKYASNRYECWPILLSTKYTGFLDASYGSLFDLEISMAISDDNLDSELILLFRSDASVSYVKTREVILTEQ